MANSLTYHTVTGSFYSEVDPIPGSPVSITPQRDQVSAYVQFSYRLPEGFTPLIDDFDPGDAGPVGDSALLFTDRVARLMNGQLCTIEVGDPVGVKLLSNSSVLSEALAAQGVTDLYVDVAFFNVTADGTQLGTLDNFAYKAPVDGTPICLTDPLLTRYEYKGTTPYIPKWQAPEDVSVTATGEFLLTATNVAAVLQFLGLDTNINLERLRLVQAAKDPDTLVTGSITLDSNSLVTSAAVRWPDSSPGTLTVTSRNSNGEVLSYEITYGSPVTKTFTQPVITRNASGVATNVPAIVVTT